MSRYGAVKVVLTHEFKSANIPFIAYPAYFLRKIRIDRCSQIFNPFQLLG